MRLALIAGVATGCLVLLLVAMAAFGQDQGPQLPPADTPWATIGIVAGSTILTLLGREGVGAARTRFGGGSDTERRIAVLEESNHYHGNVITGLAAHTEYELPPRSPGAP